MSISTYEKVMGVSPEDAGLTEDEVKDFEVKEAIKSLYAAGIVSDKNYSQARNILSELARN